MVVRRTYRDILLDKITELSESGQYFVPNKTMREALGWDDDRYWRIRQELLDEGRVVARRGQGGAVNLTDAPGASAVSVFVSYSHADVAFKNQLLKHLEPLRRSGLVDAWQDGEIKPGGDIDKAIAAQLQKANVIIPLVSVDFLGSIYCYQVELETAFERRAKGEADIVPIVLRSCLWRQTPLGKLLALPTDGKPIALWSDQDEAWTVVAEGIMRVVRELREKM
jgi:hypothetical protein